MSSIVEVQLEIRRAIRERLALPVDTTVVLSQVPESLMEELIGDEQLKRGHSGLHVEMSQGDKDS